MNEFLKLDERLLDPGRRYDFVLLFDVTHGNPNGDPDAGNLPRFDPETGHGLVTDVAIKRKIRDYVARREVPIFIQSQHALNALILKALREEGVRPAQLPLTDEDVIEWIEERAPEGFDLDENHTLVYGGESVKAKEMAALLCDGLDDSSEHQQLRRKLQGLAKDLEKAAKGQKVDSKKRDGARDRLCAEYYDVRMFGAVLSTGLNAGQVRGPMQLTFARSISPIFTMDLAITRQARTTAARMATGNTEMGRKAIVPYALYRAHGFFNPALAKSTGVSRDDLALFWEALYGMFDQDRSAARGEMSCCGLYIFAHDHPLGNAPAHVLFRRIEVVGGLVEPPRRFEHYKVSPDPKPLPAGVSLTCLVPEGDQALGGASAT